MTKKTAKAKTEKRVTITQLRSPLDTKQELALRGLGLRRIRHTVDVVDTPSTRGLILKVRHLHCGDRHVVEQSAPPRAPNTRRSAWDAAWIGHGKTASRAQRAQSRSVRYKRGLEAADAMLHRRAEAGFHNPFRRAGWRISDTLAEVSTPGSKDP